MLLYFIKRSIQIIVLTPIFLAVFIPVAILRGSAAPAVLRWYLQTSGGVFTKLGQFLAMRYDLLPVAYCQELSKLLDSLPPVPLSKLIPTIERDIGQPVTQAFATLDPVPLGSASLAQVHLATLPGGERVVVKAMRPDTEKKFRTDFFYVRLYGFILQFVPFINRGVADIISEVVAQTRQELDFRREAQNLQEMRQLMLLDDIDHYAPALYPDLSGHATITMEYIEGVSVSEMLKAIDTDDRASLDEWAVKNITPRRAAHLILRSILEQTMHHRLFQADPHASNMILMPGGTLAWVDFGVLGWLDERLWQQQLALREAIAENRVQLAVDILVSMFAPVARSRLATFEADAKYYLRDWMRAASSPLATIAEKSSGLFFLDVMRASQRAGMRIPSGLTSLFRTIIVADVIVLRLQPDLDWLPSVRAFIREERERQAEALVLQTFSLSYLSKLLQVYVGAAPTALTAMDWIDTTLPRFQRNYAEDLSRLEAGLLLVLRYSRLAFVFIVLGAIVGVLFPEATALSGGFLLLLAGLSLLSVFVLTRLIRLFR